MRILALVTDAFGGRGGIARYNRDLLGALASSSHTETVVALPRHGDWRNTDLPQKLAQWPPQSSKLGFAAAAVTAFAREPYDVIFCGHLYMSPLAAVLARFARVPMWLQLHGIEAWEAPGAWIRNAAESASLVTAVSRYTRRRFLEWADVDPARVRVLPNTVEARFTPGPKPEGLAERLGVRGRPILLTVSRLAAGERYKGQDRVLRVLPRVLARHPSAVYVIAGEGDDRERLEALAQKVGVAAAVRFVGRVADEDLPDTYRLADAFVMPSTGEGFGIVFLEAAASGVPVIAGNADGSVDALADGALGTLVDPGDAEALSRAIIDVLETPEVPDRDAVGRFGRENFERQVDDLVRSLQ